MAEVVVVGIDGSESGVRAARFAAAHLPGDGGRLVLVHVVPWSPYALSTAEDNEQRPVRRRQEVAAGEALLAPLLEEVRSRGVAAEGVVQHGHPAEVLVSVARDHAASHVVVGRVGQSRVRTLLFGSTPSHLVQISPTPVTVVP